MAKIGMDRIKSRFFSRRRGEKSAVTFSPQGTQELGMAEGLPEDIVSELYRKTEDVLGARLTSRIFFLISPSARQVPIDQQQALKDELKSTQIAQLAIFIVSYGQWLAFSRREDFRMPSYMFGPSLGERTALCASKAMSFRHTVEFIFYLGGLMHMATILKRGGMKAVKGDINLKVIESCLKGTGAELSNDNSPKQVVISGEFEGLESAEMKLRGRGYRVSSLDVAGAFHHSICMGSIKKKIEEAFGDFGWIIRRPAIPIIFDFTGKPETNPKVIRSHIIDQPVNMVRLREIIEFLIGQGVAKEAILEAGPGQVVSGFLEHFPAFANLAAVVAKTAAAQSSS